MYEIDRQDKQVVIRKDGHAIYTALLDSYIVWREGGTGDQHVSQVKDLTNDKLLLALVNAMEIKES